ncbi:hypothetical protein BGW42_002380 [Actinomortierella wolfii]|nr:hypothetical protein BGW42_002380 [Actinomortierella wolfii]
MDKSIASREANANNNAPSLATLSFEILSDLMDELVLEVVAESHREVTLMRSICPICKTRCRNYVHQAGLDIFGQNPQTSNSQTYECVSCQRSYPAQRYAPHLEKCLGLAGRASSRVANRRIGADRAGSSSPFTPLSYSDDREASDSDKDLIEKKRKKNAMNGSTGLSNGSNGSSKNQSLAAATDDASPSTASTSTTTTSISASPKIGGGGGGMESATGKSSKGSTSSSTVAASQSPSAAGPGIGEIKLGYLDSPSLISSSQRQQQEKHAGKSAASKKSSSSKKSASSSSNSSSSATPTATTTPTKKKQSGGGSGLTSSSSKKSSGFGGGSGKSGSGSSGGAKAAKGSNLNSATVSVDPVSVVDS